MTDHDKVYKEQADQYESLISREDYQNHIYQTLTEICDFTEKDMVDLGAGTGRLARMFAPYTKSVTALDQSAAMLEVIEKKISLIEQRSYQSIVADLRKLPLDDDCADIVTAGWSVCYVGSRNVENWKENVHQVIGEAKRLVRPGGTIIILETLGTGNETPVKPDFLEPYYEVLEQEYHFQQRWIRTDYRFDSVNEAEELSRFFFGDALADQVRDKQTRIVPECTGIWWLRTSPPL
jgi:ubiquinone/menaquinone biosynthesis C-methylase UbiE